MSISTGGNPFKSRPPRRKFRKMTVEEQEEIEPITTSDERADNPLSTRDKDIDTTERRKEWHGHDVDMSRDSEAKPEIATGSNTLTETQDESRKKKSEHV